MVYITSDLFEPHSHLNSSATYWNATMSDTSSTPGLGKRKRHADSEERPITRSELASEHPQRPHPHFGSYNTAMPSHHFSSNLRQKSQMLSHGSPDVNTKTMRVAPHVRPEPRPSKQLKRTSPGRTPTLSKHSSGLMDVDSHTHFSAPPISSTPSTTTSSLDPCRICHSAPKRKKDLENYLKCRSCEKRACFICARECSGGCERRLCSKCCVEVGEQGDTWCLDCYAQQGTTFS